MDFSSILQIGVAAAFFSVVLASATLFIGSKWLKRRLFSGIIDESLAFLSDINEHPEAYKDLTAPVMAGAVNAIGTAFSMMAADVQKNPDKYADILKPVISKAIKGATQGGAMPHFKWQDAIGLIIYKFAGDFAGRLENKTATTAVETLVEANPFK